MFESYSFSISALDPVEVNGYSTGATGVGINVLVYDPTSGYLYVDPDVSNGIVGATALCQFENYAGISELDSSDWATY